MHFKKAALLAPSIALDDFFNTFALSGLECLTRYNNIPITMFGPP